MKKRTRENLISDGIVAVFIVFILAFFWFLYWMNSVNPCFPCQNCHTNGFLCWCPDGTLINSTNPSCDTQWLKINVSIGKSEYCGDYVTCIFKDILKNIKLNQTNSTPNENGGLNPYKCYDAINCFDNSSLEGCVREDCNWCCCQDYTLRTWSNCWCTLIYCLHATQPGIEK